MVIKFTRTCKNYHKKYQDKIKINTYIHINVLMCRKCIYKFLTLFFPLKLNDTKFMHYFQLVFAQI